MNALDPIHQVHVVAIPHGSEEVFGDPHHHTDADHNY